MNKIETFGLVEPLSFKVFDDEFQVGRHPVRLDGTDIIPNDVRFGELPGVFVSNETQSVCEGVDLLGNINGPDARPCSEVKDLLGIFDGCFEEFTL